MISPIAYQSSSQPVFEQQLFLFVDLTCVRGLVRNDARLISRGCSVIGTIMQTWIPNHAHSGHSIWELQWLLVSGCGYARIHILCLHSSALSNFISLSRHIMNRIFSLTHSQLQLECKPKRFPHVPAAARTIDGSVLSHISDLSGGGK